MGKEAKGKWVIDLLSVVKIKPYHKDGGGKPFNH